MEEVQIIAAFDAAREAAWGTACEPRFPAQTDRIDAGRWLRAGAEIGMTPAEVVQLATDVFRAVHMKLAGQRRGPPRSLAFHDQDMADAIARRSAAPPTARPGDAEPARPRQPERRSYGSDGVTAKRTVLRALAGELGMEPDAHAAG